MCLQRRNDAVLEGAVKVDAVRDNTDSVGSVIGVAAATARNTVEAERFAVVADGPDSRPGITVDGVGAGGEELVVFGVGRTWTPAAALHALSGSAVGAEPCRVAVDVGRIEHSVTGVAVVTECDVVAEDDHGDVVAVGAVPARIAHVRVRSADKTLILGGNWHATGLVGAFVDAGETVRGGVADVALVIDVTERAELQGFAEGAALSAGCGDTHALLHGNGPSVRTGADGRSAATCGIDAVLDGRASTDDVDKANDDADGGEQPADELRGTRGGELVADGVEVHDG